jgi:methylenetetrahydrofolate--tRNA-(uracil-5-)-methyltransferase
MLDRNDPVFPPPTTALGGVLRYIADPERKRFQPMNVNFGLIPSLPARLGGKAKKELLAQRALADLDHWILDSLGMTKTCLATRAPA